MSNPVNPLPVRENPEARTFACHAARLLADSNCEAVKVLDLRGLSSVTDYFVIATGTSDRQMKSLAQDLKLLGRVESQDNFGFSGTEQCQWVIADFVDVVVHMFTENQREYYDLESLWGDSEAINWENETRPGQFANIRRQAQQAKEV